MQITNLFFREEARVQDDNIIKRNKILPTTSASMQDQSKAQIGYAIS